MFLWSFANFGWILLSAFLAGAGWAIGCRIGSKLP
jgi:hypothetical protein